MSPYHPHKLEASKRFSLQSLARIASITPTNSEQLLQCAMYRLMQQHETLSDMLQQHAAFQEKSTSHTLPQNASFKNKNAVAYQKVQKKLQTLQYIHADTHRLGQRLLENRVLWDRFSRPDRHVIHTTFLELRARHARTVETLVSDILDPAPHLQSGPLAATFLQRRLGLQLLCDHHCSLYKSVQRGAVATNQHLLPILMDAVAQASHMVDVHLQLTPEVKLEETDAQLSMISGFVNHALVEVLKNAMASSVARMKQQQLSVPSPIRMEIQQMTVPVRTTTTSSSEENHAEEITTTTTEPRSMLQLDIVDHGTGIAGGQAGIQKALQLGHSSESTRWDRLNIQQSYAAVRSPLSSLGVGLPCSKWMLEHFGGSLEIFNNTHGEPGCTTRLWLPTDDTILERIPGQPIHIGKNDNDNNIKENTCDNNMEWNHDLEESYAEEEKATSEL